MKNLVLIAHNVRSTHNVGSLLRTADGSGVHCVYLTGYTPYPKMPDDDRLPHLIDKIQSQIHKTALGAETSIDCRHITDIQSVLNDLRKQGFALFAVEQTSGSQLLPAVHQIPAKVALVVGREVEGIEPDVIAQCDGVLEIPMLGQKESLNVAQAAAIALYHCQFIAKA